MRMERSLMVMLVVIVVGTVGNAQQIGEDYPVEESDINFPASSGTSSEEQSGPDTSDINWNETVDYLLNLANNKTESKGRSEVILPDIHKPFNRRVGPVNIRGEFTARDGKMKSLSSLRRTGDVTVTRRGTAVTMTCPMGLGVAHAQYDHYRAKVTRGPSVSGSIEADIERNSFLVTVTLDLKENECVTTLDEVKVQELSGLKVKVHGLGAPFDYLLSRITNWLTEVFMSDLVRNLERGLTRELTKALEKSRCERYASYFIFVCPK